MYVLLTGGAGMLGSAIKNEFENRGVRFCAPTKMEVDLRDYQNLKSYIKNYGFDLVIHCAALVGGIKANLERSADFLLENLLIDSSLFQACVDSEIKSLLYMSSSCAYPIDSPQPFKEINYHQGKFEPTNESYAKAKIVAVEAIQAINQQYGVDYRSLVLSNLYGPGDDFAPNKSHLVAASLLKCHNAAEQKSESVEIWGSGQPRREFTFVGDVANWISSHLSEVSLFPEVMNIGSGKDYSITQFYEFAAEITNFDGIFKYNELMPDGIARKLLDSSKAREEFGWHAPTEIRQGMRQAYMWWMSKKGEF